MTARTVRETRAARSCAPFAGQQEAGSIVARMDAVHSLLSGPRICQGALCCYRHAVRKIDTMLARPAPESAGTRATRLAPAILVAAALALSGCARGPVDSNTASAIALAPGSTSHPGEDALWWQGIGDAMLVHLVETGLATNRDLACSATALRNADARVQSRSRRIDTQITRLFDTRGTDAAQAELRARAYRYAGRRAALARDIAEAYIAARRAQEVLALRSRLTAQFKDNTEIAQFRAEAGLVPGLDSGLAGSLVALNADELRAARTRYLERVSDLAGLVGIDAEVLAAQLGETGTVPDITAMPSPDAPDLTARPDLRALEQALLAQLIRAKVSQAEIDHALAGESAADEEIPAAAGSAAARWSDAQGKARADLARSAAAVTTAAQRQADLEKALAGADKRVEAARLGYRNGTGDIATLYVAEASGLGLTEARVSARADLARAAIRLWTAQGRGWTVADLEPPISAQEAASSNGEVLVCD